MLLHVAVGRPGESRFGLAVAKRLARRAVDRNRMKRLAREVFRRHPIKSAGVDLVLAPRQPFSRDGEAAWTAEIAALLASASGDR
jgi:ribonuclease P protein component